MNIIPARKYLHIVMDGYLCIGCGGGKDSYNCGRGVIPKKVKKSSNKRLRQLLKKDTEE